MIKETMEVLDAIEAVIKEKEEKHSLPDAIKDSYNAIVTAIHNIGAVRVEVMNLDTEDIKALQERTLGLLKRLLLLYLF